MTKEQALALLALIADCYRIVQEANAAEAAAQANGKAPASVKEPVK